MAHQPEDHPRRSFLKVASGAALAVIAAKDAAGQNTRAQSARQSDRGDDAAIDRALWITWYDLPESGREDYLGWLHGTYLPNLLKRPGYLWAAHYATRTSGGSAQIHHTDDPKVPSGFHYVLIVGVRDALVFGKPIPSAIHAELPEQGRRMLARVPHGPSSRVSTPEPLRRVLRLGRQR